MNRLKTFMLSLILTCAIFFSNYTSARPLGQYLGDFEICHHPIDVSKDNLKNAYHKHSNGKIIRICGLIDTKTFSEQELNSYGWKVTGRIGDVVTITGDENTAPYIGAVEGIKMVQPYWNLPVKSICMDSARRETKADVLQAGNGNLPKQYKGKNVIIGMIDTEFDIHHPDFLGSTGKTRFIALWDQSDSTDTLHNGFSYGTMKSGDALNSDTTLGLDGDFHGTLMTSYASGSDTTTPYYGMAPEASIIGVKYTGTYIESDVINGLKWMFGIADSLGLPCVVSMSIGIATGPHDGTSLVDRVIDSVTSKAGHIVVGAIGNDGIKKSHISFALNGTDTMGTWVDAAVDSSSGVRAISYTDIWGDSGATLSALVYVLDKRTLAYKKSSRTVSTQTTKTSLTGIDEILWNDTIDNKTDTVAFYSLTEKSSPLNGKSHITLAMVATNSNLLLGMRLSTPRGKSSTVHAWNIEKLAFSSESIDGFYEGDSASTLNEIGGTAKNIITVGAYCSKWQIPLYDGTFYSKGLTIDTTWGKICNFSGTGPTVDGRIRPDVCAPGDMVVGAMSRRAADDGRIVIWPDTTSTYGRYIRGVGTSVSAPIVAGAIALMFEANPTLTCNEAKQYIRESAYQDDYTGTIDSVDNKWGAGKLDIYGAMAKMLGIEETVSKTSATTKKQLTMRISHINNRTIIFFNNDRAAKVLLYNVAGKLILSTVPKNSFVALPISLSKGIYIVYVQGLDRQILKRKISIW
jgi:minor extracellular serine protease Vpr